MLKRRQRGRGVPHVTALFVKEREMRQRMHAVLSEFRSEQAKAPLYDYFFR